MLSLAKRSAGSHGVSCGADWESPRLRSVLEQRSRVQPLGVETDKDDRSLGVVALRNWPDEPSSMESKAAA